MCDSCGYGPMYIKLCKKIGTKVNYFLLWPGSVEGEEIKGLLIMKDAN